MHVHKPTMGWPDRASVALERWMGTRLGLIGIAAFGGWIAIVFAGLVTRWLHPAFAATVVVPLVAFLWLRTREGWSSTPWRPERPSTGR